MLIPGTKSHVGAKNTSPFTCKFLLGKLERKFSPNVTASGQEKKTATQRVRLPVTTRARTD